MKNIKDEKKLRIVIIVIVVVVLLGFIVVNPLLKFKKMEKQVLDASKRYYEINENQLPTGNKIKKVTLRTLYDKDYIDSSLNIPFTNKSCNLENSFVRVTKLDAEYKYNVYLECGIFRSSTDHKGPVIKLKGKDEVIVYQGEEYKDAGIESVKDNTDGKMDINDVDVDTSKVDTSKVGNYEVTYTAKDSLNNVTVKVRTVKVTQTLNNIVEKNTDSSKIYKGMQTTNYVQLDGILFKMVGVNSDGSVKLVSDEALASVDYNGIDSWLNDYFYEKLSDSAKEYIKKDSKWCIDTIDTTTNYTKCSKYTKKKAVGILSVIDYNNAKDDSGVSNLVNTTGVWTYNKNTENKSWINSYYDPSQFKNVDYKSVSNKQIANVKPAINIVEDAVVTSGDGTNTNPYILENNKVTTKKGEKISSAVTGSYISYSGYNWRVISSDEDGTTKVIMIDSLNSDTGNYYTVYDTKLNTYNPTIKDNIGYKILNKISGNIKTNYFVSKEFSIKNYGNNVLYNKEKSTKDYKLKLCLNSMFDLYSANLTSGVSTWYQETSTKKLYINSASVGIVSTSFDSEELNGIRLVGYLNKSIVIKGGTGTKEDPYTLTK